MSVQCKNNMSKIIIFGFLRHHIHRLDCGVVLHCSSEHNKCLHRQESSKQYIHIVNNIKKLKQYGSIRLLKSLIEISCHCIT